MKSIMRRLLSIGFAVPALLGAGAGMGSAAPAVVPATVPSATLASASVTFITGNDNKDFDTRVTAQVETPGGRIVADFSDIGVEYPDNTIHGPSAMRTDTTVTAAMLSSGLVRISIEPNGHDTWHFSYRLIMSFSDGTTFEVDDNNLSLSESNRELTTPFTLVTQVVVPRVIGLTLDKATTKLQSVGLVRGTVDHEIDPTCNNVGKVSDQDPDVGTKVPVGSAVNLTIGTKPDICL